jgi:hypothetical protein
MDMFHLAAPGGDTLGIVGMSGKPPFHGVAPIGRQFAVDIGVEFVLGDVLIAIDHVRPLLI